MTALAGQGATWGSVRSRLEQTVRELGAEGVVVSVMTLRVRSEGCRAHQVGADHFAEVLCSPPSG